MEKTLFGSLKALVLSQRKRFFGALLMLLGANILLVINPLIFRQAILALSDNSEKAELTTHSWILQWIPHWIYKSLIAWTLLLLITAGVSAFLRYQMRMGFISISRDAETVIRSKLFDRIQAQSRTFFDKHGIGELLSRLTNDIGAYRDLLGVALMYPLLFITMVGPGLLALHSISPYLTYISMIPLLCIPIVNELLRHRIYHLSHTVQQSLGVLSNMTQEHYSGIRIVKSYCIEKALFERFCLLCRDFASLNVKLSTLQGLLFPLFTLITKITSILLVLFSGYIILRGWEELSAADFVSFMWIQSYLFFPVLMLGWVLPIYARGKAAYDRLVEIYDEPIEVQDATNSSHKIPPNANILIKELTFKYPQTTRNILSNINLEIQGGSFVGITGPVGSGKSTLFRLLNREYEILPGKIFIGGLDIHDYPLEAFHSEMVSVEQIPFLFSKTVAENVRLGRQEASQADIEIVSEFADMHETILGFPKKYETLVGERGVTLSGGQKQRMAIARAFLVDRSILLLDDIFSAVDSATEKRIFSALKKHYAGKTVLLITHRSSVLEQMDRIIYLANGKICEDGTPEELFAKNGYFKALSESQSMKIEGGLYET